LRAQPAKKFRATLKWPRNRVFNLGGTSKAEDVLFIVGVVGLVTWIVGCLVLIASAFMAENSANADRVR
jgi:hypothetical protein